MALEDYEWKDWRGTYLKEEGVTVIPEHHASGGELVDGIDLSSQGGVTRGYSTEEAAYTLFLNSSGFSLIIFLLSSRVMPTG